MPPDVSAVTRIGRTGGSELARRTNWGRRVGWTLTATIAVAISVGLAASAGVWAAGSSGHAAPLAAPPKDASCTVGAAHRNPAFDPINHYVYVPNPDSSNISVLAAPCTVVATISTPAGSEPGAAAFDPSTDDVWVTDYALNQVYVISGTKIIYTVVSSGLTYLDGPRAIAFDPGSPNYFGCMIVANYLSDNVTVVCYEPASGFFGLGQFSTGSEPIAIAYDPVLNYLAVANYGGKSVTLLEPNDDDFQPLIYAGNVSSGGSDPDGIAYDPAKGCLYIANFGSNDVTQWCAFGTSDTIKGFDQPTSVTWSQAKLAVYVTNWGSGGLWAVGGEFGISVVQKISSVPGIEGSTYDSANNDIYVTNDDTDTVYVYAT